MRAPELMVRLLTDKFVAPILSVPPEMVTAPLSGNLPLPLSCTTPALTVVPPVYTLLPERVKVPEPLLTKCVAPLIAPVIALPVLEVLIVKVETFDTVPPIVAAPLPAVMVREALCEP